jgi:hypothetical protein
MTAPHYTPTGFPAEKALASSIRMREELALIEAGIDEMDTHVVSIMVQPWKTSASDTTHDWCLVMPLQPGADGQLHTFGQQFFQRG